MIRYAIVLFIAPLYAQVSSGSLAGEIHDASGASVAGAEVTAKYQATGVARVVRSDGLGVYRFADLPAGSYTLTVQHPGSRSVATSAIVLEVNQRGRFDFTLAPGNDSVTIEATLSKLQDDASEGYRFDAANITRMPLVGRNILSLVTIGPGAIPRQVSGFAHDVVNDAQAARGATAFNPPVNGARSTMNSYIIDGAYNTDRNTFAIAVNPPLESTQEFRVQSSLGSAEFPQAAGATVDIVTKSGGRDLHGNVFEFLCNDATDARNYFDNPSQPKAIFRQNQFGGTLGGPLGLPSTFFFATYAGLRSRAAKSTLHLVPTEALRGGNFAGLPPLSDPYSGVPFPGNVIPANRIDPIAAKYLAGYEPLPNLTGNPGSNYIDATPNENDNNAVSGRIDHQLGNQLFFGRYTINNDRARLAGNFPERASREDLRAQQAVLGNTYARAAWTNEARFSFTRLRVFGLSESAGGTDVLRDLGITSTPNDPSTYGLPYFVVTNFQTVTDSTRLPQTQRDNTWYFSDGWTYLRGRHTWKAGFQFINFQFNYLQSQFIRGRYIFNGNFSGDPFADFLIGVAQSTRRTVGSAQAYLRQNTYAGYIQDEWRVSPRLTLNFGLRYEYIAPFTETRNNLINLDYSTLPNPPALVRVSRANNPDRNNFAPRFGLAYRIHRSFVFRAGYGIFYNPEIAIEAYDLVRNSVRYEINETAGTTPVLTLQNGFPTNSGIGFPSYSGLDTRARTPYLQQLTGGFQAEIGGTVLEAAYVGSKGNKLGRFRTFNTPAHVETGENLPPRPGDLQSLRTFPSLGPIFQRQHISNSSYHSLQIKAEKRLAQRLSFLASFVWSKSIDDADSIIPGLGDSFGAQDERNLRLERGLSVFNVGRRLSASAVYAIPAAGFWKPLLANWTTSGIMTLQDGMPWNPVYFGTDFANSGTPNRPDRVLSQSIDLPKGERSPEQAFNRAAFQNPKPFTFGNAGRNILPSPGAVILDLSLQRRFPINERAVLQFRAEVFNVANHPNFGIPGQYPDFGPFFARIFATGEPRRFQFGLRLDF